MALIPLTRAAGPAAAGKARPDRSRMSLSARVRRGPLGRVHGRSSAPTHRAERPSKHEFPNTRRGSALWVYASRRAASSAMPPPGAPAVRAAPAHNGQANVPWRSRRPESIVRISPGFRPGPAPNAPFCVFLLNSEDVHGRGRSRSATGSKASYPAAGFWGGPPALTPSSGDRVYPVAATPARRLPAADRHANEHRRRSLPRVRRQIPNSKYCVADERCVGGAVL